MLLFLACLPPHLASRLVLRRSGWPSRFLRAAARICGARATLVGEPPREHTLLVCNHVSWLDILVLGGATGCRFVSKDDLGHGFIHWLADQNRTIYVRRQHRTGARDQAVTVARALELNQPVAIFPEGTVGPGNELLPFRSTLLESVSLARRPVEVRPVALDYGSLAGEISWHGERGTDNVLRILGRRGTLPVAVRMGPPLDLSPDRKRLAQQAREAIRESLASSRRASTLYADAK